MQLLHSPAVSHGDEEHALSLRCASQTLGEPHSPSDPSHFATLLRIMLRGSGKHDQSRNPGTHVV